MKHEYCLVPDMELCYSLVNQASCKRGIFLLNLIDEKIKFAKIWQPHFFCMFMPSTLKYSLYCIKNVAPTKQLLQTSLRSWSELFVNVYWECNKNAHIGIMIHWIIDSLNHWFSVVIIAVPTFIYVYFLASNLKIKVYNKVWVTLGYCSDRTSVSRL